MPFTSILFLRALNLTLNWPSTAYRMTHIHLKSFLCIKLIVGALKQKRHIGKTYSFLSGARGEDLVNSLPLKSRTRVSKEITRLCPMIGQIRRCGNSEVCDWSILRRWFAKCQQMFLSTQRQTVAKIQKDHSWKPQKSNDGLLTLLLRYHISMFLWKLKLYGAIEMWSHFCLRVSEKSQKMRK